jgi:transposase
MEMNEKRETMNSEVVAAKKKTLYPQEFKDQVIGVYKSGVYNSVPECAAAYNLCARTLYIWLDKYNKKSAPVAVSEQQLENSRLKKELANAKMENDILKKATIYFASQAR